VPIPPASAGSGSAAIPVARTMPSAAAIAPTPAQKNKLKPLFYAGIPLVVLIAAWLAYRYLAPARPKFAPQNMSITRLTDSGRVHGAAISPDGKWLTFTQHDAHQTAVYVKQLATGSVVKVVASEQGDLFGMTFSPDGNYLYYAYRPHGQAQAGIYVVPSLGGTPQLVISNSSSGPGFSPDGQHLAFIRSDKKNQVIVTDANDRDEKVVLEESNFLYRAQPSWSTDGKSLLLTNLTFTQGAGELLLQPVSGGSPRRVPTVDLVPQAAFLPDGGGIVSVENGPDTQFSNQVRYRADLDNPPQRLTNDLNDYGNMLTVTRDGKNVVVVQSEVTASIAVGDLSNPDRAKPVTAPSSPDRDVTDWTTDGRIMVTVSGRIFVLQPDGSGETPLHTSGSAFAPTACGDGRSFVYSGYNGKEIHIVRAELNGSHDSEITSGRTDWLPACSPDGSWVAYFSHDSGSWALMRISAAGGTPATLYPANALTNTPSISGDGKLIGFQVKENGKLEYVVLPANGAPPTHRIELSPDSDMPTMVRDASGFLYVLHEGDIDNLWLQSFAGGTPKQLTHFTSDHIYAFALSQDGKRIALTRGNTRQDAVMLSNFR